MTPEELEKLACAIAEKLARKLGESGSLTSGPEDLECFNCTGRFKLRCPNVFTLTSPPPQSGSTSTSAVATTTAGATGSGERTVC